MLKIDGGQGRYYIVDTEVKPYYYLHTDGILRQFDSKYKYMETYYFNTKQKAQQTLNKYLQKNRISIRPLKSGNVFRITDGKDKGKWGVKGVTQVFRTRNLARVYNKKLTVKDIHVQSLPVENLVSPKVPPKETKGYTLKVHECQHLDQKAYVRALNNSSYGHGYLCQDGEIRTAGDGLNNPKSAWFKTVEDAEQAVMKYKILNGELEIEIVDDRDIKFRGLVYDAYIVVKTNPWQFLCKDGKVRPVCANGVGDCACKESGWHETKEDAERFLECYKTGKVWTKQTKPVTFGDLAVGDVFSYPNNTDRIFVKLTPNSSYNQVNELCWSERLDQRLCPGKVEYDTQVIKLNKKLVMQDV